MLQLIWDALRGVEQNYTDGPVRRSVILLAIPMAMEMVMESVFAVVDVFFVSKVGADAVATVGLTEAMMAIVYTVALGLGIGATAVIARRTGEQDKEGAARAASQALLLGLLVSAVLGLVAGWQAERLLGLMGATPSMIASSADYTRIMFAGNATVTLLFLINAIFRGAGDASVAMRLLWIANGINIVLDPCLIFGIGPFPELGVTGAAVATNIGRGTAVLIQIGVLFSGQARVRVAWRYLRILPGEMWMLCRLSGAGLLQMLIDTSSWIGLVRVIASFGSDALAGYTIAIRIVMFAILPAWGLSNAAATMVGQALGAGKPDRAEEATWTAGRLTAIVLGAISIVFLAAAPVIVGVFTSDPAILPHAVQCLRIVSLGFVFFAYGLVLTQAFNGAGDPWTPTWLNFACFWLWQIPLAYGLAIGLGWGPAGVYWAITIAFSTLGVAGAVVFKQGRWKSKVV
jgi:putative MATE family efflux protein